MDLRFSTSSSGSAPSGSARPCEDKAGCNDLRFVVNQINGELLEFSMPVYRHFADLKEIVANHFQIPVDCQRFYDDRAEALCMKDSDSLTKFLQSPMWHYGAAIPLTVVAQTEELVARLESPSSGARVAALGNLAKLGTRVTPQVKQVCRLLATDHDHRVRRCAACVLPSIVMAANEEEAVDALITRFGEESNKDVQEAIATAMAHFVATASLQDCIFASAEKKLQSDDAACRRMGLVALSKAAQKGNARVAAIALKHLADSDAQVRLKALQTLVHVSLSGQESAITAVCGCLLDQSSFVRSHALAVLPDMLRSCDERACDVRARILIEQMKSASDKSQAAEMAEALAEDFCSSVCSPVNFTDTIAKDTFGTKASKQHTAVATCSCFSGVFSMCSPSSMRSIFAQRQH